MTGGDKGLQGVTRGDREGQEVTGDSDKGLHRVTGGLRGVTAGDQGLQGLKRGYKRLQAVSRSERG